MYTYLIGWSKLNKYYYGSRFAKDSKPSDLWFTYFTSSNYVKAFRKEHGEPDIIQIRKTFKSADDTRLWEHKVLRRMKVVRSEKWLNKTDNRSIDPICAAKGRKGKPGTRLGSKNPKLSALNKLKVGSDNPFYGKKHVEGFNVGSNNAMYGIRGNQHPRFGAVGAAAGKKWFYDPKTLKAKYFNVSEAPLDWLPGRKSKKEK